MIQRQSLRTGSYMLLSPRDEVEGFWWIDDLQRRYMICEYIRRGELNYKKYEWKRLSGNIWTYEKTGKKTVQMNITKTSNTRQQQIYKNNNAIQHQYTKATTKTGFSRFPWQNMPKLSFLFFYFIFLFYFFFLSFFKFFMVFFLWTGNLQ